MLTTSDDKKLELLNDHYKDTFAQIREYIKLRDRIFAYILVTITLLLFQIYSPDEAGTTIGTFIAKSLKIKTTINIAFVGSAIWFALLALIIRYFQTVIFIERQYTYIHGLEDQLSRHFAHKAFTREGKSYLTNYPKFSDWTYFLYTMAFPVLLILVVAGKVINEIVFAQGVSLLLVFNIAIAISVVISTILYLRMIHFHK